MPTINRIIDISKGPVSVRFENKLLVFTRKEQPDVSIPVKDIGVLVMSTPYVSFTQPAITELAKSGVSVVFADLEFMPVAMCLPIGVHHQPATRFIAQANASKPMCKRLWKQIVQSKLLHQASLLLHLHGDDYGVASLVSTVKSGDSTNVEGHGARIYWDNFFKDKKFKRDRDAYDANLLLNYGYTVLRAITARAICATGLHPGLGIFHHHRNNSFCLADDLMEPFRVYVDYATYKMLDGGKLRCLGLNQEGRKAIVEGLLQSVTIEGRKETLFYIIQRLASSLANVFGGSGDSLRLPKPQFM